MHDSAACLPVAVRVSSRNATHGPCFWPSLLKRAKILHETSSINVRRATATNDIENETLRVSVTVHHSQQVLNFHPSRDHTKMTSALVGGKKEDEVNYTADQYQMPR